MVYLSVDDITQIHNSLLEICCTEMYINDIMILAFRVEHTEKYPVTLA